MLFATLDCNCHTAVGCSQQHGQQVTTVTAKLMNSVLGNVLKLIRNNIGSSHAPWMNRIASKSLDRAQSCRNEFESGVHRPGAKVG